MLVHTTTVLGHKGPVESNGSQCLVVGSQEGLRGRGGDMYLDGRSYFHCRQIIDTG